MLTLILLWFVGLSISAPTWFFVAVGCGMFLNVLNFGLTMYKKGCEKEED